MSFFGTALLLQQAAAFTGNTSPPTGDTTGYWQQRVAYTMVAHLDEGLLGIKATGQLRYVNNSPDTLREMYFHQYLNAFRPHSKWSEADTREHRLRFQDLAEPDYGYERFTSRPLVDGVPTVVDYPGSPDSTVVHLRLPRALPPGDSITVSFAWEARPSIVPRRQGRRGRSYDFAQWYPKVAVYDRGGWEPNALVPAGELYGEFGTYDVTIVARNEQVLGATGVVVSGDPGWARVSRTGAPWMPTNVYRNVPEGPVIVAPLGERPVRFYAEHVHHFAWTASPQYIYEGATYLRRDTTTRHFPTYDTVAVNVLYRPGDDTTWGGGRAAQRTLDALAWLEKLYGPYAYPQITNDHRIDRGGTEFPMMIMDGSASFGLIDHELGHVYTYGILANNEWRSAWLDEGLTEYQSRWAQNLTPQDNQGGAMAGAPPTFGTGYRAHVIPMAKSDSVDFANLRLELMGRSEPVGRNAAEFNEFGVYNDMVYDRAAIMYGHLRDLMGDSVFVAFLRDYYNTWAFKHVDERAMRRSAERAYGASLGWFLDEWLRGTGLLNYSVGADTTVEANGKFVTRVRVTRLGELRDAMPVGVHTVQGWTIGHAKAELDDQWVDVQTTARPDSISLDPFHTTWDWDRRDNTRQRWVGTVNAPAAVFDWPFLDQSIRSRTTVALAPRLWYSGAQGLMFGIGAKTNYIGMTDVHRSVIAVASHNAHGPNGATTSTPTLAQFRFQADDVYLSSFMARPLMGVRGGGGFMDGIVMVNGSKRWDLSPFAIANGPTIGASVGLMATYPTESLLLPEQWSNAHVTEIQGSARYRAPVGADSQTTTMTIDGGVGYAAARDVTVKSRSYARVVGSIENVSYLTPGERTLAIRLVAGVAPNAPLQRSIFASSRDPWETFDDDYFRPRSAALKQRNFTVIPLGGARLRGFSPLLGLDRVVSGNVDASQRLKTWAGAFGHLVLWAGPFVDAGVGSASTTSSAELSDHFLVDAGAGLTLKGKLYDRDLDIRLAAPLVVNHPVTPAGLGGLPAGIRWTVSW